MGVLALILGILGGLGTIMSVLTATEVIPLIFIGFTDIYWLGIVWNFVCGNYYLPRCPRRRHI